MREALFVISRQSNASLNSSISDLNCRCGRTWGASPNWDLGRVCTAIELITARTRACAIWKRRKRPNSQQTPGQRLVSLGWLIAHRCFFRVADSCRLSLLLCWRDASCPSYHSAHILAALHAANTCRNGPCPIQVRVLLCKRGCEAPSGLWSPLRRLAKASIHDCYPLRGCSLLLADLLPAIRLSDRATPTAMPWTCP